MDAAQVSIAGSRLKVVSCATVTILGFLTVAATGFLMLERVSYIRAHDV